ncbi:rab3 GTPase-activating protein catalytic subunit-like [Centruroides sculpturatus]|uniref:rab3 GTPase-activating protein catalytic subunit-like n=1 Tax=Centruroides sculpturatus TaxID=218467 RepID=UPI000C6D6060|nr:rab3 GTPase-activating protein catalytic subunit-like [Centruroides sculpturatus]
MSSEEEQDVFEITDFTTASEWERFIARIEEIIHEWKLVSSATVQPPLKKNELITSQWEEERESLLFANVSFDVIHHYIKQEKHSSDEVAGSDESNELLPCAMTDVMSWENDFPPRAHCLVRWYGLRDFIIIHPSKNNEAITNEDKAKLLLSSICIAINNTNCSLPIFVQLLQPHEKFYTGICEGGGFRMNFEMVRLHHTLPQYNHLSGLLNIYRSKLGTQLTDLAPITVSIRFTYIMRDWSLYTWPQPPPDINDFGEDLMPSDLGKLPFGATEDPIIELQLSVTWMHCSADVVVDNDVHSDLDPLRAPKWSVRVRMTENPACLMDDYLKEFFSLSQQNEPLGQIIGKISTLDEDEDPNFGQALDKLANPTAPIPSLQNIIYQSRNQVQVEQSESSLISDEVLIKILQYIFPDSVSLSKEESIEFENDNALPEVFRTRKELEKLEETFKSFKAAPPGSLTWRLSLALCKVNYCFGGIAAVAHLWQEVLVEMRHRWENNYTLPCLESGSPNLTHCLLHQKFQMLNCCIQRKKVREWNQLNQNSLSLVTSESREPSSQSFYSESDGDDEYFECNDASNNDKEKANSSDNSKTQKQVPEGRLKQLNNLTLLHSGAPLFIPITQEPSPMTEDMLEEHAEILVQLGTNSEGAALRARMQSACLMSDMEAFKAANPGACLEDFVQWYSPRDLIEETITDEETGKTVTKSHLSARMLLPGNMWQEAWESSRAVPAHRQKRLFDDTKEAEKILHYLAAIKPVDLVNHLMPVLIYSTLVQLAECVEVGPPSLATKLIEIANRTVKVMHMPQPSYKDILSMIYEAEVKISQGQSLYAKFCSEDNSSEEEDKKKTSRIDVATSSGTVDSENENSENTVQKFCLDLVEYSEVEVPGGSKGLIGNKIRRLFAEAQRNSHLIIDEKPLASSGGVSSSEYHSTVMEFPKPSAREFILRANLSRPTQCSGPSPQRMYCLLTPEEFRLAGAFSEDTTFQ